MNWGKSVIKGAVSFVCKNAPAIATTVALGLASTHSAHATDPEPFDYTVYSDSITGGLTVIGAIVAAALTMKFGILICQTIAKLFRRST